MGIFGRTQEEMSETSKKAGTKTYQLGIGVHSLSSDEKRECGSKGGKRAYELGVGVFALSKEERSEISKKVATQKWICLETGHISTPGGLARYQKARGIDTSKRKRIS